MTSYHGAKFAKDIHLASIVAASSPFLRLFYDLACQLPTAEGQLVLYDALVVQCHVPKIYW